MKKKISLALALAMASVMALGAAAEAADQPISAKKIVLKRSTSGKEKLVFVSSDPAFLCPAVGTADDPSDTGLTVELFSGNEGNGQALVAPPGESAVSPGWKVKDGPLDIYKYSNKEAPGGVSPINKVVILCNKVLKVIAKNAGLPLLGPNGTVGIRLTQGSTRNCAYFDSSTLRKDEANKFIATKAQASSIANCTNPELGGTTNCCEAHGGLGCDTGGCQAKVCAVDLFCCNTAWDSTCRDEAELLCTECGGLACAPNCPGGTACTSSLQCASTCDAGFCAPACSPNCGIGQTCTQNSHCTSNACVGGVCKCAASAQVHTFSKSSNGGGAFDPAEWGGGTQSFNFSTGCNVSIDNPSGNIDLVGALGDRWRVIGTNGFSTCVGSGAEDGDGCDVTSCPFAGIGSCEATRPSCSVGLNGSGTATYRVVCNP